MSEDYTVHLPEVDGSLSATMNFSSKDYPGDAEIVQAWHDLEEFIMTHDVLRHSEWYVGVEMGGAGSD